MRTAAFTLGLIGGILGLIAGILEMFVGGTLNAFSDENSGAGVVGLGFLTIVAGIVAIVGASLAKTRGGWAGVLMLVAMIVGFVTAGYFWIPSGVCLLAAGICAFAARDDRRVTMP